MGRRVRRRSRRTAHTADAPVGGQLDERTVRKVRTARPRCDGQPHAAHGGHSGAHRQGVASSACVGVRGWRGACAAGVHTRHPVDRARHELGEQGHHQVGGCRVRTAPARRCHSQARYAQQAPDVSRAQASKHSRAAPDGLLRFRRHHDRHRCELTGALHRDHEGSEPQRSPRAGPAGSGSDGLPGRHDSRTGTRHHRVGRAEADRQAPGASGRLGQDDTQPPSRWSSAASSRRTCCSRGSGRCFTSSHARASVRADARGVGPLPASRRDRLLERLHDDEAVT